MAETMLAVGSLGCENLQKYSIKERQMKERRRSRMSKVLANREAIQFRERRLIARKQIQAELQ
jgi:hypothetical protein